MDQWYGKLALVTGASSGIGEAITIALLHHNVNVVGLARRLDKMKKLEEQMKSAGGKFYPVRCDVRKEQEILDAFKFVEQLGGADILVNNAGLGFHETISDGSIEHMKTILDVNVLAAAICTREITKSIKQRGSRGHIININSILGHNAMLVKSSGSLYEVSKYGITAMSEVLRREMTQLKLPIKVTSLSPGFVNTDMPVIKDVAGENWSEKVPHLESKDIADGALYVLGTPANVQVNELTITPMASSYI
ncbi:farnesol dehydrogenase-like [Ceratina calcarata]|uniref:Farnesol dehydrogenase-like n=1 Tax=Ceratina calcarata TaxID=156304 RepID=A0AAJ7N7A3_9HYME|nr:farnesol dehydrogenase-like [Ceratina calcarata]